MQAGKQTIGDGMRRHLVMLEREQENLASAARVCAGMTTSVERLEALDAGAILERLEEMEREGTTFMNKQAQDFRPRRYIAAILCAAGMTVLMAGLIWLFLWAVETDPAGAPPLPVVVVLILVPAFVILGVVLALAQRVREIRKGEADDARAY